ncbi:hypothetical protein KGF56_000006 [Candida oxycetoniae]|uniref:Uncharacterized protein n=1 Tax=Candida oxycetoniae TaxID=497107 RepID=A0AAI9T1H9_9ASCO|nr:uncharacterized protein KGF56_000006 [Candida oxycetoniae]KAI3407166.1 hypothetical protein KGF56_000006 [Candida oxycetoniae]
MNSQDTLAYTELPAQAYMARISNRPALAAVNGMVSSFPLFKIFTSNALPILVAREDKNTRLAKEEELETDHLEAYREFRRQQK